MSASTNIRGLWSPIGLIYPAMLLGGLAIGLWLRTVAIAQVAFFLLVYPLMLMRLATQKRGHSTFSEKVECPLFLYLIRAAGSSAIFLIIGIPFYVAAAWFGDATYTDVIRSTVFVCCLIPLTWSAGFCFARNSVAAPWVFLTLLVAMLGLPAGYYIGREFLSPLGDFQWLWHLAPATAAWHQSAPRVPSLLPRPLWPPAIYLAAAIVTLLLQIVIGYQKPYFECEND